MKRRGRGIACMWYPIGFTVDANPSAATVKMNEDGTAMVLTGTVETGQGSLTVLGQIAAEALGIATDDVHLVSADTDTTPMDTGAIASRTTYVTGNAIWLAAEAAKAILFETAAPMLGVTVSQLEANDRKIQVKSFPQRNVPIGAGGASLAGHARPAADRQRVVESADRRARPGDRAGQAVRHLCLRHPDRRGRGRRRDRRGRSAAHRRGARLRHAINPMLVEGQVEGGISMGVGLALQEEILFDADGRHINPNLTNYIVPTSLDMPEITVDIVQNYDPTGPFGAKGVGEPTPVPTAAAILNAIHDAVGVRVTSLPATAEKVLAAIKAKRGEEQKQIPA